VEQAKRSRLNGSLTPFRGSAYLPVVDAGKSTARPKPKDGMAALAYRLWSPGEVVPKTGRYRCVRCPRFKNLRAGEQAPPCDGNLSTWIHYSG